MEDSPHLSNAAFEPDGFGSLRDITVPETDEQDWQRVLDFLRAGSFDLTFSVDGKPTALPASAVEIFAVWQRASPALHVEVAGVRLGCYFFEPSAVEFDFDPRDVTSDEQAAEIVAFMRGLGEMLGKPVLLTHESEPRDAIVRFDPALQDAR